MTNQYVERRLAGIQQILNGVHQASAPFSSASKGQERAAFIDSFLANVLPPNFRFGTGDATDSSGSKSGQLDVVVEYPVAPTLPSVSGGPTTRLYLAESVAAVIEVKSDVSNQWAEALRTSDQLAPLRRSYGATMTFGSSPTEDIPLFVAGYTGWKQMETVERNLLDSPGVAGILVIDAGLFVSSDRFWNFRASGPWALWGLICCLHGITNALQGASTSPSDYW